MTDSFEMASLEVLDLYSELKPILEGQKTDIALACLGTTLLSIVRSDVRTAIPLLVMLDSVVRQIEALVAKGADL